MESGKPFYKSRTLGTGLFIVILTWLMQLTANPSLLDTVMANLHLFGLNPSPDVVNSVLVTLSVVLVSIWRLVTKEPIRLK